MKKSTTKLSYIKPNLLEEDESIQAWFTLKNQAHSLDKSKVQGLNLGLNTKDNASVVEQNRMRMISEFGIAPDHIAYADQVHGNRVQVVSGGGTYGATDGLMTTVPGLTLAIQVADCAAVLLWDSHNHVVGAYHAGWRGAVADIVPKGIEMMKRHGAYPHHLKAFISPCLSQDNFEVGEEVAEQFPADFVDGNSYQKPHVDLKGFLQKQLEDKGLKPSHIEIHSDCTIEGDKQYYSYRREGEQSGRMMALIQIER